jgi:hypothetical protein
MEEKTNYQKKPTYPETERSMRETKVFVLNANTEFELVQKMNQEFNKRKVFASQPMQKQDKTWVCFIYYS